MMLQPTHLPAETQVCRRLTSAPGSSRIHVLILHFLVHAWEHVCAWLAGRCAAGIARAWGWGWGATGQFRGTAGPGGSVRGSWSGAAGDLAQVVPGEGTCLPSDVAPSLCSSGLPTLPGSPGPLYSYCGTAVFRNKQQFNIPS